MSRCNSWGNFPGLCQYTCKKTFDCANPPASYEFAVGSYWKLTAAHHKLYRNALIECRNEGAHLAAIRSVAELDYIRTKWLGKIDGMNAI